MKEIFIVEDDEGIRELIDYLLTSKGYIVQSFASAEKFREKIIIELPHLVLLDIVLPDGDGRELCRDLRSVEKTRHLPVILMSANSHPQEADGANDFISKPFDIEDFLNRIRKQL